MGFEIPAYIWKKFEFAKEISGRFLQSQPLKVRAQFQWSQIVFVLEVFSVYGMFMFLYTLIIGGGSCNK